MLIPVLYEPIYLIFIAILTLVAMGQYSNVSIKGIEYRGNSYPIGALFVALLLALFLGFRPHSLVFTDTTNYVYTYNALSREPFIFSVDKENIIFDNLFSWWASNDFGITTFFVIVALGYFGCILFACVKMFPKDIFLAFVMYLGAFSTFSYGTNGIKAGLAAAVFLIALAYREQIFLSIIIAIISYGLHHSMQVVVVAYIITFFFKKPKYYLYGWLFCLLLGALHVTFFQELFAGLTDEHGAEYLTAETDSISGFRIDFILYSAVPIILGYRLERKYNISSPFYNQMLNLYTLVNAVWLLCLYATDINRIAYLSWLMYPFVLLYPFVKLKFSNNQYIYLKYVVFGHVGFTLFMFFIYYGLIRA